MAQQRLKIAPCTVKAALAIVQTWHRHLPELQGGLFAARCMGEDGALLGVAVAGNPSRAWQNTGRIVIARVATEGAENACSCLYGALCRAAKALGYREAWTYTLPDEPGTSLRAAGFMDMGMTDGGEWNRPSRPRKAAKRSEPKRRWLRKLAAALPAQAGGSGDSMSKTRKWIAWALAQETDECLLWPFSKGGHGYGDFRWADGHHCVHVYVCEQAHGPKPSPAYEACHGCNTPLCGNKRHLRWDTRRGNFEDKVANGTVPIGESHPSVILTEIQVLEIRAAPRTHGAGVQLAEKYGVHPNTIYAARGGRSWRHVPT